MVKVNYIYNGKVINQIESTPDEVIAIYKGLKNHKYRNDNTNYIISDCVYNIFDEVVTVTLKRDITFLYDTFIPNYKKSTIEQLEYIGYVKSDVAGNGKHLITSHRGYYYFTDEDYSSGIMGYVAEGPTALAIAALTNDTDRNQWFIFPNGQCEFCESDSVIDEWGDFNPTEYPRKMTVNEIYSNID